MAALEQELEALEMETELEGELEGEFEAEGELEFESEFEAESEFENEGEFEAEGEISPVRKIYADAMMEHMAHMAAEAETEEEAAEHFLPLIGMAASKLLPVVAKAAGPLLKKALPKVARAVTRVTPQLTRGVSTIARSLHRNPGTRRLLHAVPSIARRTVHSVARQAAHGRSITPRSAVRTLAQQTRRVLSHRPHRMGALRRSRIMDRRFHRRVAPGVARPHRPVSYRGGAWGRYTGAAPAGATHAAGAAHHGGVYAAGARPGAATGSWASSGVSRGAACPPCPSCSSGPAAAAAPAYCGCCGQLLR